MPAAVGFDRAAAAQHGHPVDVAQGGVQLHVGVQQDREFHFSRARVRQETRLLGFSRSKVMNRAMRWPREVGSALVTPADGVANPGLPASKAPAAEDAAGSGPERMMVSTLRH